ncbi:MAG: 4-hydroxy-3-methylbut-2-enyl diphosphate reductase [Lachnospiraceae bacterium]|jgi:4-hydroxy-3-methylbut-2-enyl diphosphate reductase|nr:4-hydroxy-3-methylbut-2-enyl diphosphate reductase [Lachnospiraceae bacterium]
MEVRTAKSAGFCPGVKRAVDLVYEQAEGSQKPVYTYGPIIHNEEVVKDLEQKGVRVVDTKEQLADCRGGTVIIRSHGVSREVYDMLKENSVEYVDATCPFVRKIHQYVERYSKLGYHILIIGNSSHPEVEGIRGWGISGRTSVLSTPEEAEKFRVLEDTKLCIVAQTTFNNNKFKYLVEIIEKKGYDIIVLNTICNATQERQREAKEISAQVDAMIVIGGKNSSNTQKLFEICKKECENTYYIQTIDDLDVTKLQSIDSVGITAGASTPNYIIKEVQTNVRNEF